MGYEIGDTFETRHGKMTVVDSLRIQGKNGVLRKYYMLRCEKGHQYPVGESYLKAGRLVTCKKCNHPTIAERDPEFAKWFVDSSIPWEKSPYTHLKADFYCPECGKIVKGKNINNVYQRRRVQCPYCGDGISYPERYIHALLTQMQIPFVRQYTVKFQENGRKTHYKYDFYDQERNTFIETHEAQHFVPHVFERVGRASLEKIQQRDHEKRRMAVEQLGIGYIDLDCRKSAFLLSAGNGGLEKGAKGDQQLHYAAAHRAVSAGIYPKTGGRDCPSASRNRVSKTATGEGGWLV